MRACQTPRVCCEHESDPAGSPSSALGRRPAWRWPEAEVAAQECPPRCSQEVPPRRAARHRAHAQGSVEPSHAPVLPSDQARSRARMPALRLPARALLRPGEPPALHRRGSRRRRTWARHEGAGGADGAGAQQGDVAAGAGVRGPVPRPPPWSRRARPSRPSATCSRTGPSTPSGKANRGPWASIRSPRHSGTKDRRSSRKRNGGCSAWASRARGSAAQPDSRALAVTSARAAWR